MNKIISLYIFEKKQETNIWLLSITAFLLLLLRVKITHSMYLLFLIWNLFLAIIPNIISTTFNKTLIQKNKKLQNTLLVLIWILFLPNTFYILTDFTHLHFQNKFQFVLDILILSSFSITGFYLGLHSILHVHTIIRTKYSKKIEILFIVSICFISSFGVYLGRVLRFNSWDNITKPVALLSTSLATIYSTEAIVYTIKLGGIILISYLLWHQKLYKSN